MKEGGKGRQGMMELREEDEAGSDGGFKSCTSRGESQSRQQNSRWGGSKAMAGVSKHQGAVKEKRAGLEVNPSAKGNGR